VTNRVPFCDSVGRRDFLRLGTAGLFGMGLSMPALLRAEAHAQSAGEGPPARDVSLIFVFLHGGMSTIDAWDMKPDAPAEFRGEFAPIATRVPGIDVCEHMPRLAGQMDKVSLIRSFRHGNSGHGQADHYMLTGYNPTAAFNPTLRPNNQRPSIGSVMARKLGPKGSVPPYVCLPKQHPSTGSAYLGASAAPFVIDADPNAPDFAVPDIVPPPALELARVDSRRELLSQVDRFQRTAEAAASRDARSVRAFRQKAFDLMTSSAAKAAFDIHSEPEPLRDEYGRNSLGQGCLMARRLVEAGVRCVTIDHSNWDTHSDNFGTLKNSHLPALDAAMATLFRDLADRGMLERTLVVVSGEFGRTPRINKDAGRDHWGNAFTVALGGGGIRGGVVIGRTDARAEKPSDDPHGPENLTATIHRCLGIDPDEEFLTPEGRPVKIVNNGRVIPGLV
jgi:uncharacterized protein (DUF1501 family)